MDQQEYLALLFNECGFDTVLQRRAWLSREFNRDVSYADELDWRERSMAIDRLKTIRDGQNDRARADWKRDEDE